MLMAGLPACCIVSSVVHLGLESLRMMGVVFRPPGGDAHNYRNLWRLSGLLHPEPCDGGTRITAAHQTSARYRRTRIGIRSSGADATLA